MLVYKVNRLSQHLVERKPWLSLKIVSGSSNGRTPGFGPGNLGSNPSPEAMKKSVSSRQSFSLSLGLDENQIVRQPADAGSV